MLFVWPKRNSGQSTEGVDLSTITITIGKPNGGAQTTSGMTQADYFVIKVECCRQSEKIIDAEDKISVEVLHNVYFYLNGECAECSR
jgi:hypothetical protein